MIRQGGTTVLDVVAWLAQLPPTLVYVVAAGLVLAETGLIIGLALPGEITLIVVGFLASLGTVDPYVAVALLIVAALGGDALAFVEGRRYGPRLRASRLGQWVGPERWSKTDALLQRHGGRAVFLGRYVAFARTLLPRLCGVGGMPYRRFVGWDALGVVTQVASGVLIGYLAGGSYQIAAELLGRATGASLLLVLVLIGLVIFGRYLGRHPDPVTAFGERLRRWRPLRWLDEIYDSAFAWFTRRVGVGGAVGATVVLGVGLLLAAGIALTELIDLAVRSSGFPLVDPLLSSWFADQRSPETVQAARVCLSVLRGSFLVIAAGVVGLVLNRHPARWRADVLGVLGTVGAFIPLLILAAATELAGDTQPSVIPVKVEVIDDDVLYANQVTLVTASVGLVAWLVTRRFRRWGVRVACWITAVGVVLLVSAARLYLGWNWPSEVVASVLLGGAWVTVFVVAWRTRDRLRAADPEAERTLTGTPGSR
jgi:undecaprenyl-diphosphatase